MLNFNVLRRGTMLSRFQGINFMHFRETLSPSGADELGGSAIRRDKFFFLAFHEYAIYFDSAPAGRQRCRIFSPVTFGNAEAGEPEHRGLQE